MTVQLRTALQWLDEQHIAPDAECWVLAGDTVEPVTSIDVTGQGDILLTTAKVWDDPAPVPMLYDEVHGALIDSHSGGGALHWRTHSETYRGSYVVNPERAVFFVFLPDDVSLSPGTYTERVDQRREQAKQLTREIERERRSWER